jgi:hypothetical protein
MLTSTQLQVFLRNHRSHFLGVRPMDQLPRLKITGECCFIVNTDPSYLPGQHWLAVYVDKHRNGECFDSFGRLPPRPIQFWLNANCNRWCYNNRLLQSPLSTLCGAYCIFYLAMRCFANKPMSAILNEEFSESFMWNDDKMRGFMYCAFNYKM